MRGDDFYSHSIDVWCRVGNCTARRNTALGLGGFSYSNYHPSGVYFSVLTIVYLAQAYEVDEH